MLNIVVPMAGHGSRFSKAGFALPKPLIPIHEIPMIQLVISNLTPSVSHRFIFICQQAHLCDHGLQHKLEKWAPGCSVLSVDAVTEGAACTVLLAKSLIDDDTPLMIANCDQYVEVEIDKYLKNSAAHDGYIMTMRSSSPKWSYVGFEEGRVSRVVEKQVISDEATVGIYNFAKGRDFVRCSEKMIRKELRVNGEFYVAPVYNELIAEGSSVGVFSIGSVEDRMHGLGIPEDLADFVSLQLSKQVTGALK